MSNVEIVLDSKGISELMKSEEIVGVLQETADNVISKCSNGNYYTSQYVGKNRANVSIATADKDTYYRNLKNNELLKAL